MDEGPPEGRPLIDGPLDLTYHHPPGPVCDRFEAHTHRFDGSIEVPSRDPFYKGGPWHTVELLALLNDATKVQRTPCDHAEIGKPGCVICDPRIREALGFGLTDR